MKTIKVSEATGPVLDYLVAKCAGRKRELCYLNTEYPTYSTSWSLAGPIIEREEIGVKRNAPCSDGRQWEASPSITAKGAGGRWGYGPTPLIAAMRCYVASKLGDEVEAPEELE